MKKAMLVLFVAVCSALSAQSQCCPYINGVTVSPASPLDTDTLTVTFVATTPNQGLYLGQTHYWNGDTLVIDACYFNGFLTALQTYVDSIHVGPLPAGSYAVHFIARISSSEVMCVPDGQMQDTVTPFIVDLTNRIMPVTSSAATVFPNPAEDMIVISTGATVNRVRVINVSGGVMIDAALRDHNGLVHLQTAGWPAGIYIAELSGNGLTERTRFVRR